MIVEARVNGQPADVTGPNLAVPGAILRDAGDVESVALRPNRVEFLIGGDDTGGSFSLTAWTMAPPPAPGPPLHIHLDADEAVYVVEGTLECHIGDDTFTASAGAVVLVPRGTLHTVANPGPHLARFLVVLQPPGFEGYWREMARLTATSGQPDPERVLALQETYHMQSEAARRFEIIDRVGRQSVPAALVADASVGHAPPTGGEITRATRAARHGAVVPSETD